MTSTNSYLDRTHRFFARQLLYPLVLSSFLSTALWLARLIYTGFWAYGFLPWNLFLAWIPYLLGMAAAAINLRYPGRWWLLLAPSFLWLIFFPNAPYIVTDLLHLDEYRGAPLWYDIGLIATYAWTGLFLGVASLNTMQGLVRAYLGRATSWLFAAGVMLLSGLGIYLGRFLNWNSWDLFFHPQLILASLLERMFHPVSFLQIYGFTFIFAAFLLVCYITFISVQHAERSPE